MSHAPAPLRSLILDFDGVILESNGLKTDVFREVFGRFPEHADEMMRWHYAHISTSRYQKFEHLVFNLLGRKDESALVDELASEFSSLVFERMCSCAFVPGAIEFLDEASARVAVDLASVTPEPELLKILAIRDLRKYFRRVFGCPPWTKPQAVAEVVGALGGAARLALIGDSPGDRTAADSAGVEFIARDSGIVFDPRPSVMHNDMNAVAAAILPRLISGD